MKMAFWEEWGNDLGVGLRFEIEEVLFEGRSEFQKIGVYRTPGLGRVLLLDNLMMLSERDEHAYHEMLAHVPAFAHPQPRNVLIIGAGDGGLVREVLKHESVERVDWVEIDPMVIEVCTRFLGDIMGEPRDDRVHIHNTDGAAFVRETGVAYDVILVDSTDPIGPAVALFGDPFYDACREVLTEQGVFAAQIGSPILQASLTEKAYAAGRKVFPQARIYLSTIPVYPGSHWCFLCCREGGEPPVDRPVREGTISGLRYYNPAVHRASFALPEYVTAIAREAEAG
jgi:spermidine synthase